MNTRADLEKRITELNAIADWLNDLTSKLRRAHLRFEFCGLDPEEQEQLEAEAEAFKQVCRCLWRISRVASRCGKAGGGVNTISDDESFATHKRQGKTGARLDTVTALDLQERDFPPLQFVVPGFVVEGLTLIAGKPKIGKSWMVLDWALAVAYGGVAFGSVRCEVGDVLYCALEDNQRRLQRRLQQLLPDNQWPDRLEFITKLLRLNDGGLDALREWARKTEKPRLIVIDTFKQVKPLRKHQDGAYDSDYDALAPLQGLAGELGIAIIVVHHTRKQESEDPLDTVSGTTGITGAVDTALVLNRDSQGTTLYGRGRDIDDIETAVTFEKTTGRWAVLGDAVVVRLSDSRKAIITALKDAKTPLAPKEIADASAVSVDVVRHLVLKMAANGEVTRKGSGKYVAA